MADFSRKAIVERERCLALVMAYRQGIQTKMALKGPVVARDQKIADAVIAALLSIEENIKNPEIREREKVLPGDFSIEEMELAERIIQEQQQNPFEG